MKRVVALILCVFSLSAGTLCGCDNAKSKGTFSITDIDWRVEEKDFEGKNTVVFSYKNNSSFTITGVDIEFRQRENLSEDELSVLEEYSNTENDLSNIYITANNYYFTKADETSEVVPCNLVGSWNFCHSIQEYNIMEPTKIRVAYIKDDKMFGVEYDFKKEETINLSENGKTLFEWTEGGANGLIPKPNKQVVQKSFDYDDHFSFAIWDATEKDFNDYIEQCKQKGFVKNIDETDYFDYKSYKAEDEKGSKLHIYYKPKNNHSSPCRIEVDIKY